MRNTILSFKKGLSTRPIEAQCIIAVLAIFIISGIVYNEPVEYTVSNNNSSNNNAIRLLDNISPADTGAEKEDITDTDVEIKSDGEGTGYIRLGKSSAPIHVPGTRKVETNGNDIVDLTAAVQTKPIMHTFYEPVGENGCCGMTKEGHENLLAMWKKSWEDKGWETKILTEKDAQGHPSFKALEKKLVKLRISAYNRRCYWRWLAMVQVGGGWMSDYDAFPLELDAEMGISLGQEPAFRSFDGFVPCLIHASGPEWDRVIHLMMDMLPDEPNDEFISDMHSLDHVEKSGEGGVLWTADTRTKVSGGFHYDRGDNNTLSIKCDRYSNKLVVHVSHAACAKAVKEKTYPFSIGKDEQIAARRAEAAAVLLGDYRDHCN